MAFFNRLAAGELLIRISAVGITRTELQGYPNTHTRSGEVRRHAIPMHEFSGVVAAVGRIPTISPYSANWNGSFVIS